MASKEDLRKELSQAMRDNQMLFEQVAALKAINQELVNMITGKTSRAAEQRAHLRNQIAKGLLDHDTPIDKMFAALTVAERLTQSDTTKRLPEHEH